MDHPRSEEVLELVQTEAALTVRIRVKHTSADRPDGYPFSKFRGQDVAHTGTGVITDVCAEGTDHLFDSDSDESEEGPFSDEEDDDRDEEARRRDFEAYEQENRKPAFTKDNCPCYDCEDVRYFARHKRLAQARALETLEMCEGAATSETNVKDVRRTAPNQDMCSKPQDEHGSQSMGERVTTGERSERPCWLIIVETALHVVYDTKEARNSVVDVFYDKNSSSPRTRSLFGYCVTHRFEDEDRCIFECATHNEELVRMLSATQARRYKINKSLGRPMVVPDSVYVSIPANISEDSEPSCSSTDQQMTSLSPQAYRMAIIIGHPHGRSKTISVGQWTHRVKHSETKASVLTHYLYDAATCKGNSGGAVMTFGKMEQERVTTVLLNHHHRSSSAIPGLNMSSPCLEYTHEIFKH